MSHQRSLVAILKRTVIRALRQRGFRIVRTRHFDADLREQGLDWPLFCFTMTGMLRLNSLQSCIESVLARNVPGDFVETGVWRGGSAIFAKAVFRSHGANDRVVWCCDSFEGMPVPSAKDLSIDNNTDFSDRDYLVASEATVRRNFSKFGLSENVRFVKGWFCDTLPSAPIKQIAILRIDGDLYDSTRDVLYNLYHKVSPGGYVIVDDYKSWKGCRKAVDEFRMKNGILDEIVDIDPHAIFWRRSM
jgi:O-methyltransferase